MLSDVEHDELVSSFYASASGETPWAATLERTADLFGSTATLLGIHRPDFFQVLAMESHNYSKEFISSFFNGEIWNNDPRIPYLARVAGGCVYYDEALYDVGEMERNPWVKASIDSLKVFDQIGAKLRLPSGCYASFGLLRTQREGRVTPQAVRAFQRIVPQIERTFALGYALERRETTQAALLGAMAYHADAFILLDTSGVPFFVNDAAERLLASNDGLTMRAGTFVTSRPPQTRRLQRLVGETLESFRQRGQVAGGQMLVSRISGRRPYVVRVVAPPARDSFLTARSVACVVYVKDLSAAAPSKEALREVFGLSNREADFAVEFVLCAKLEPAASRCGIALNTARNHLRSIFEKTGVASQAEAVQLLSKVL